MKKLLSVVISLFWLCILTIGCRNTQPAKSQSTIQETSLNDTVTVQDTAHLIIQTAPAGSVGEINGMNKDSVKTPVKSTAIIHTSPEQDKIDSIKNAKPKIRK